MPQQNKNYFFKIILPSLVLIGIVATILFSQQYFKRNLFTVMKVPAFKLTNQNGKTITDKDMLGKVYLVEFFFSTCPTICPVMNSNMKYINDQVADSNFGVISISIDPKNDTPEILKEHALKIGVQSENWHLLTGDRTYIGNIADEFDIYVGDNSDESESLNHSGMFALVDKNGNIRSRFDENNKPILYYSGLNYEDPKGKTPNLRGQYRPDVEWLIEDIKQLLKE